jgi:hypothetical protein
MSLYLVGSIAIQLVIFQIQPIHWFLIQVGAIKKKGKQ